jgi:RNA polymerase sigma factor (sigma-70 family)
MSPVGDGEAIGASLAEPSAFEAVFDRHFGAVHRFVRRRVGLALVDDIASETFVRAFTGRARFDTTRTSALPWLLGIAVNLISRHYRDEERQLRAYARTGVDHVLGDEEAADNRLDAAASKQRLAAALADLRAEERDVLLLHAWADLGYEEIAEALRIPVGTVRSRLSRARTHVREALAQDELMETRP